LFLGGQPNEIVFDPPQLRIKVEQLRGIASFTGELPRWPVQFEKLFPQQISLRIISVSRNNLVEFLNENLPQTHADFLRTRQVRRQVSIDPEQLILSGQTDYIGHPRFELDSRELLQVSLGSDLPRPRIQTEVLDCGKKALRHLPP
jgi:hypothetical protein